MYQAAHYSLLSSVFALLGRKMKQCKCLLHFPTVRRFFLL